MDYSKLAILTIVKSKSFQSIVNNILMKRPIDKIYFSQELSDAFNIMRKEIIDIMLIDDDPPQTDGVALTRAIRMDDNSPNRELTVIMLTDGRSMERTVEAINAGVHGIVLKPPSVDMLFTRIVSILSNPRSFVQTETYFGPDRRSARSPKSGISGRRFDDEPTE